MSVNGANRVQPLRRLTALAPASFCLLHLGGDGQRYRTLCGTHNDVAPRILHTLTVYPAADACEWRVTAD